MPKLSKEKLKKYRALDRDMWDWANKEVQVEVQRWMDQGWCIDPIAINERQHRGFFQSPFRENTEDTDIVFLGIPMEMGAIGRSGSAGAARAVRERSLVNFGPHNHVTNQLPFGQCSVIDAGDVDWSHLSHETQLNDVYEKVLNITQSGAYPLSVGGEHTSTYSVMKALSEAHGGEAFGLVHIDGHADTMGPYEGQRVNDGSCLRYAVIDGYVDPERTVQIGIRGRVANAGVWDFSYESGMTVIPPEEIDEKGMGYVIDKVKEIVGMDKAYFTLDVDGIDASEMMGTNCPEQWGVSSRDTRKLIHACHDLNMIGADLMCYNPAFDPTGYSGLISTALLWELFCMLCTTKERANGKKNPTNWR